MINTNKYQYDKRSSSPREVPPTYTNAKWSCHLLSCIWSRFWSRLSLVTLDLLSRLCLSSVLWCGLWSGLWSGAALSSPVGCRFSPHMKNNHRKKKHARACLLARIICLPPHTVRLHAHTMHVRHDRGTDAGSNHICRSHSRSAQRLHSQNDPR